MAHRALDAEDTLIELSLRACIKTTLEQCLPAFRSAQSANARENPNGVRAVGGRRVIASDEEESESACEQETDSEDELESEPEHQSKSKSRPAKTRPSKNPSQSGSGKKSAKKSSRKTMELLETELESLPDLLVSLLTSRTHPKCPLDLWNETMNDGFRIGVEEYNRGIDFMNELHQHMEQTNGTLCSPNFRCGLSNHQSRCRYLFSKQMPVGLLYHRMGTGKTITAMAIAAGILYNEPSMECVGFLTSNTLLDNLTFWKDFVKCCKHGLGLFPRLTSENMEKVVKCAVILALSTRMMVCAYTNFNCSTTAWWISHMESFPEKKLVFVDEVQNLVGGGFGKSLSQWRDYLSITRWRKLLFMTGTPIRNSLEDLMCVINMMVTHIMCPKCAESYNRYLDPKDIEIDSRTEEKLSNYNAKDNALSIKALISKHDDYCRNCVTAPSLDLLMKTVYDKKYTVYSSRIGAAFILSKGVRKGFGQQSGPATVYAETQTAVVQSLERRVVNIPFLLAGMISSYHYTGDMPNVSEKTYVSYMNEPDIFLAGVLQEMMSLIKKPKETDSDDSEPKDSFGTYSRLLSIPSKISLLHNLVQMEVIKKPLLESKCCDLIAVYSQFVQLTPVFLEITAQKLFGRHDDTRWEKSSSRSALDMFKSYTRNRKYFNVDDFLKEAKIKPSVAEFLQMHEVSNIPWVISITGDGSKDEKVLKKMLLQLPKLKLLAFSKVGKEGLNLPTCATMIMLTAEFNMSTEDQVTARCVRRGMKHPVSIIKMVNGGLVGSTISEYALSTGAPVTVSADAAKAAEALRLVMSYNRFCQKPKTGKGVIVNEDAKRKVQEILAPWIEKWAASFDADFRQSFSEHLESSVSSTLETVGQKWDRSNEFFGNRISVKNACYDISMRDMALAKELRTTWLLQLLRQSSMDGKYDENFKSGQSYMDNFACENSTPNMLLRHFPTRYTRMRVFDVHSEVKKVIDVRLLRYSDVANNHDLMWRWENMKPSYDYGTYYGLQSRIVTSDSGCLSWPYTPQIRTGHDFSHLATCKLKDDMQTMGLYKTEMLLYSQPSVSPALLKIEDFMHHIEWDDPTDKAPFMEYCKTLSPQPTHFYFPGSGRHPTELRFFGRHPIKLVSDHLTAHAFLKKDYDNPLRFVSLSSGGDPISVDDLNSIPSQFTDSTLSYCVDLLKLLKNPNEDRLQNLHRRMTECANRGEYDEAAAIQRQIKDVESSPNVLSEPELSAIASEAKRICDKALTRVVQTFKFKTNDQNGKSLIITHVQEDMCDILKRQGFYS